MQSFWIGFGPKRHLTNKDTIFRGLFLLEWRVYMYSDIFDLATLKSKAKYMLYQKSRLFNSIIRIYDNLVL